MALILVCMTKVGPTSIFSFHWLFSSISNARLIESVKHFLDFLEKNIVLKVIKTTIMFAVFSGILSLSLCLIYSENYLPDTQMHTVINSHAFNQHRYLPV